VLGTAASGSVSTGLNVQRALLDLALEKQIIEKRGSWISYKGTQLAQGRDAAKEALKNDKNICRELRSKRSDREIVGNCHALREKICSQSDLNKAMRRTS
jgi:hypothetical protein